MASYIYCRFYEIGEKISHPGWDDCHIRWLPAAAISHSPVVILDIFLADSAASSAIDHCHSFGSLDSATGGGRLTPPIFTGFASSNQQQTKKSAIPVGMTDFLELLARFELATSSLPTILKRFLPCVACRKLLDKTLVHQGLLGFAYRCLL